MNDARTAPTQPVTVQPALPGIEHKIPAKPATVKSTAAKTSVPAKKAVIAPAKVAVKSAPANVPAPAKKVATPAVKTPATKTAAPAKTTPATKTAPKADTKPSPSRSLDVKPKVARVTVAEAALSKSVFMIDPRHVSAKPGFNPRIDMGTIEDLAKSILANEQLVPIRVSRLPDGKFQLVDGERRLLAFQHIIKKDPKALALIEAKIVSAEQSEVDSLVQMFEANSGKPFTAVEEAIAYARMRDAGMTLAQITERVGRGHMHIQTALALADADPAVREAIDKGKVKKSLAKHIAFTAKNDPATQKALIAQAAAAAGDATKIKQVHAAVDKVRRDRAAAAGRKEPKLRALSDDQLKTIGERVSEVLFKQMEKQGLPADAELDAWVKGGEDDLRVAYMFGALQGLKAAAGMSVPLTLS